MKTFRYKILPTRIIKFPAFSFLFLAFSFFSLSRVKAQQFFSYSQYMNNLTPLNPAYSVLDNNGSINALVRKQWLGIPGAPTTRIFNANLPLEPIGASMGLVAMDDQFAVEHLTEVNAYFAKSVRLTKNDYLAVSMDAGLRRYMANYSSLDPNDPQFRDNVIETKPNLGFGVMLYSDKYYLGVSLPELTVRSLGTGSIVDNTYFRNHYNFSAAYLINVAEDIDFKPAGLLTYTRGIPVIADISGTFYMKKMVGFGLDYRTNTEMAGIMSISFDTFRFGYSYQVGTASNNIGGINFATQELTLTYRFGKHLGEHKIL
jgi:type IX secretion system PorP/SprF family membrane protein